MKNALPCDWFVSSSSHPAQARRLTIVDFQVSPGIGIAEMPAVHNKNSVLEFPDQGGHSSAEFLGMNALPDLLVHNHHVRLRDKGTAARQQIMGDFRRQFVEIA